MGLPEKLVENIEDGIPTESNNDADYEILPEKEVKDLREELKKAKEFEIMPTKRLHISINELNNKLDKLIAIFDDASRNIKVEEGGLSFQEKMRPLAEKMNKILEQNSEIAEGVVALADLVKDFRGDLENKGIIVEEKKEPVLATQSQSEFASMPTIYQSQAFPARMSVQRPVMEMPRIAPPPFEMPKPPSNPPPLSPPKKRLFGL